MALARITRSLPFHRTYFMEVTYSSPVASMKAVFTCIIKHQNFACLSDRAGATASPEAAEQAESRPLK